MPYDEIAVKQALEQAPPSRSRRQVVEEPGEEQPSAKAVRYQLVGAHQRRVRSNHILITKEHEMCESVADR